MLPGLNWDAFLIHRIPPGADDEGNPHMAPAMVGSGRGTFGSLSAHAVQAAAQQGFVADAALSTNMPAAAFALGDILSLPMGRFRVVAIKQPRTHRRLLLSSETSQNTAA